MARAFVDTIFFRKKTTYQVRTYSTVSGMMHYSMKRQCTYIFLPQSHSPTPTVPTPIITKTHTVHILLPPPLPQKSTSKPKLISIYLSLHTIQGRGRAGWAVSFTRERESCGIIIFYLCDESRRGLRLRLKFEIEI